MFVVLMCLRLEASGKLGVVQESFLKAEGGLGFHHAGRLGFNRLPHSHRASPKRHSPWDERLRITAVFPSP